MVSGSTGNVLPYSDDLVWNPRTQEAFFIGADHLASQGPQFVSYSARTNTWQRLPRPAWLSGLTFFHGYDHTALDPVNQRLFHRPFGQNRIHRYDIAAQTWSELPPAPLVNTYANCCDALEHFPALGGLIWVRGIGEIWLFSDATQQWRQVATFTVPNGSTTWTIAEHSAATQTVVLGAGGLLYRLNAVGQVTPLVQPPQYYDGSGFNGVLTTDPVSGDFLLLSPTARVLRVRDAATDTWTQISAPGQPSLSNRPVIATPIAELGVTVFASCAGSACRMHLFKR